MSQKYKISNTHINICYMETLREYMINLKFGQYAWHFVYKNIYKYISDHKLSSLTSYYIVEISSLCSMLTDITCILREKQNTTPSWCGLLSQGGLNGMPAFKLNFFPLRLPKNSLWLASFTTYMFRFVNSYASRLILFCRCTANGERH